jgi:HPt (histidine-containing phosphotransfer) domain-containing protein
MSNTEPDLDLSLLYEIADGSNEFVIESIDMFLANAPGLMESLSRALSSRDWPAAASTAHILKSNVGFFGMPVSQGLMQEIEIMANADHPDHTALLVEFNEVKERMCVNLKSLGEIKAGLMNSKDDRNN